MSETETKDVVEYPLTDISAWLRNEGDRLLDTINPARAQQCFAVADEIDRLRSLSTTVDVEGEREACARLADDVSVAGARWRQSILNYGSREATAACSQRDVAKGIAAAIRSRGPSREGEKDLVHSTVEPAVTAGSVIDPAWQLVPKEPTPEMIRSGSAALATTTTSALGLEFAATESDVYRAMLSASPTPPEETTIENDCEDQGMGPTDVCLKFECQQGFDAAEQPIRPKLVLRGKFWCCPSCGGSYGEFAKGAPPAPREVTLLKEAAAMLALTLQTDDFTRDGKVDIPALVEYWRRWTSVRDEPHHGDCIKFPVTCMRCVIEECFAVAEEARAALSSTASGGENG